MLDLCGVADICAQMDQHSGQAAWAQAVGSVVAIGASTFFAIWTPLHVNRQAERNAVQRAINNLLIAADSTGSTWEALQNFLARSEFDASTADLLLNRTARARAILDEVPASMMLGTAYVWTSRIGLRLHTLETFLARLAIEPDPETVAKNLPIQEVVDEFTSMVDSGRRLAPRRITGHWMIYHPEDADDIRSASRR